MYSNHPSIQSAPTSRQRNLDCPLEARMSELFPPRFETKVEISFGTLSTPFIYQPRSRPAHPIPAPLDCNNAGFIARPEWKMYSSVVKAHPNERGLQDIVVKFYIPSTPSRLLRLGVLIDTRHQSPEYSGLGRPSSSTSPLRGLRRVYALPSDGRVEYHAVSADKTVLCGR